MASNISSVLRLISSITALLISGSVVPSFAALLLISVKNEILHELLLVSYYKVMIFIIKHSDASQQ